MSIGSTLSLGFLGAVLLLASFLEKDRQRQLLISAVSLLFLAIQYGGDVAALSWTMGFAMLGFAAARGLRARPSSAGLALSIGLIVGSFLMLKNYFGMASAWNTRLPDATAFVGLSYMLFRSIHVVIDAKQGQLAKLRLADYVGYQFSFLTLLAGPIQRFDGYQADLRERTLPAEARDVLLQWHRLLLGVIEIAASAFLWQRLEVYSTVDASAALAQPAWARAMMLFYGFPVYVFLNFSGYCDTMIGAGRLLGIQLPENFDRPYLATDLIDFWNRWHITLSTWIRDYVFNPTYAALVTRRVPRATAAYGAMFLALFLAGVWHGSSPDLIVFGALHGVGAAGSQWLRNRERGTAQQVTVAGQLLRRALTLNYVAVTFLFLPPLAIDRRFLILGHLGLAP